jgi:fimbrial chaperone protein
MRPHVLHGARTGTRSVRSGALVNAAATLALLSSLHANAGSLAVSPLRLTYANTAVIAAVTVENNGESEALVQTETFSWKQIGTEHRLTATEDIIAMPPVFRLAPGARQQVRVGLTRAFSEPREQTFRLMVTEVPTSIAPGSVAVAVRHSLPIFVLPVSPISADLTIKQGLQDDVEIANSGSKHMRILRWRVRASSGVVIAEASGPGYLLAGASQRLAVAGLRDMGPVVFEADTEARALRIPIGR